MPLQSNDLEKMRVMCQCARSEGVVIVVLMLLKLG